MVEDMSDLSVAVVYNRLRQEGITQYSQLTSLDLWHISI